MIVMLLRNTVGRSIIKSVIALAIFAVILYFLNPPELFRRARDSDRLSQISNLGRVINNAGVEQSLADAKKIYISVADPNAQPGERTECGGLFSRGLLLASLPSGWEYDCVSRENLTNTDGTGWIPINFSSSTPIRSLPIDPINTVESGYYYSYISDGRYALASALLESHKYTREKASADKGTDPARYETGTNIDLWAEVSGLRGYWKFDEGAGGAVAGDSSGKENHGQVHSPAEFVAEGKVWGAVQFRGGGYIEIGDRMSLHSVDRISMAAWINPEVAGGAIYGNLAPHAAPTYPMAEYSFELAGNGTDFLFFANPSDYNTPTVRLSGLPIPEKQWTFVAATWDGESVRYYQNGVLADTKQYSLAGGIFPTNIPYRIGARNYKEGDSGAIRREFIGMIDNIRVYARTLTAAEVMALYNATK